MAMIKVVSRTATQQALFRERVMWVVWLVEVIMVASRTAMRQALLQGLMFMIMWVV